MAHLVSVNVGRPRDAAWTTLGRSAIEKRPVAGPVRVERLGIEGDEVFDTKHHGGVDQAVYAYAREDLDRWAAELGRPVPDGMFGENLTTSGLDLDATEIGTRWRAGTVLLEVASVRIPCNTFKGRMGEAGYDNSAWVKRFTALGTPGPYLRVVEPGVIAAGDAIEVVLRPGHDVTVRTMFAALTVDRSLRPRLLEVEDLPEGLREEIAGDIAT